MSIPSSKKTVHVACDGSALRNPTGPGGWSWYVSEKFWAAGNVPQASNNQMELTAFLKFLEATQQIPHTTNINVYLDSQYVIDAVTKWARAWEKNGWQTRDGKPVKNVELIREIRELYRKRTNLKLIWVRGHAGHDLNEAADQKARTAALAVAKDFTCPTGPGWAFQQTFVEHSKTEPTFLWPPTLAGDEIANANTILVGGDAQQGLWGYQSSVDNVLVTGHQKFVTNISATLYATMVAVRKTFSETNIRLIVPRPLLLLFTANPVVNNKQERFYLTETWLAVTNRGGGWGVNAEMEPFNFGTGHS